MTHHAPLEFSPPGTKHPPPEHPQPPKRTDKTKSGRSKIIQNPHLLEAPVGDDQNDLSAMPFLVTKWISEYPSHCQSSNKFEKEAMNKIQNASLLLAQAFKSLGTFGVNHTLHHKHIASFNDILHNLETMPGLDALVSKRFSKAPCNTVTEMLHNHDIRHLFDALLVAKSNMKDPCFTNDKISLIDAAHECWQSLKAGSASCEKHQLMAENIQSKPEYFQAGTAREKHQLLVEGIQSKRNRESDMQSLNIARDKNDLRSTFMLERHISLLQTESSNQPSQAVHDDQHYQLLSEKIQSKPEYLHYRNAHKKQQLLQSVKHSQIMDSNSNYGIPSSTDS